jgi:hypothetical protein
MQEKTILGVRLRRRIITTVNGMGRKDGVRVFFRGTRAYTNGKDIVLPAIRDLAEIPYSVARALIGFAIHEVAHVRYTDFDAILRAIEDGRMEPDALIKKFENCIEDYRIEGEITKEFPGAASDLTDLRIRIHPKAGQLSPQWLADPRACGPLALTWTGSLLNGFLIPEVTPTLDSIPAPVRALIDSWTVRMTNVASTEEAVDLAIVFAKEAMDYAVASRAQQPQDPSQSQEQDKDEKGQNSGEQDKSESEDTSSADDQKQDEGKADPSSDENEKAEEVTAEDVNTADEVGSGDEEEPGEDAGTSSNPETTEETEQPNGEADDTDPPANQSRDSENQSDDRNEQNGADQGTGEGSDSKPDGGAASGEINDDIDFGTGVPSPEGECSEGQGGQTTSSVDLHDPDAQSGDDSNEASAGTPSSNPASNGSEDESSPTQGEDDKPFGDALDPNAAFDDFLDDLRDAIAANPLPEDAPDATDGEVDPTEVLGNIAAANSAAPDYTSPDADPADQASNDDGPQNRGRGAGAHFYDDKRFVPVEPSGEEDNEIANIISESSGIIGTTARTIRRLLMAEEQKGVHRNRRDGSFDIRNISAIVRQTGTCYKKQWDRPAPETHLTLLADFSGSMSGKRLNLAVTGMFAVNEATRNTSIETSLYGFCGYSPEVILYAFKEGRQSQTITRKKIGNYLNLDLDCTPTGEAMAAVGELLEDVQQKRRVLVVMTDGQADNPSLCEQVIAVLQRRGIEVVGIGIQNRSITNWCPNSHVIDDISQLPNALLACIDPRGTKAMRKAA